ncbi:MAG TPA: hypothetical protein VF178_14390 [Gemmatimonadaceae bacterium]
MRATVLGLAVASLVAANSLSAQETAAAATSAGQDRVPSAVGTDTLRFGGRTVPAGDTVVGPVLVVGGDLRVQGVIDGAAVAVGGDIVVEDGGRITGDAVAALGRVRTLGGVIQGRSRSFDDAFSWAMRDRAEAPIARRSTADALSLALGWLAVVLVLGIGVLIFAGSYLEGVADVIERSFWRSFLIGVAGELAVFPVLVLLITGLAITVVGILLIPFAIVAYILAIAGLVTLGFLAMARVTGGGIGSGSVAQLSSKGYALRGIVVGIALYLGMWVVAAAFQWSGIVSGILRAVAFAITYVAATAGFGAAILSRGGTRRDAAAEPAEPEPMEAWQTPTPVTGVAAARRPTPVAPRERY